MKTTVKLENIDPVEIYGAGNRVLEALCGWFPQLKVVARGEEIMLEGSESDCAGFEEKISRIAAAKGGSRKVSGRPAQRDGGFLLVYGGIEENCTIRAVFDAGREEMSDRVNRMLFG